MATLHANTLAEIRTIYANNDLLRGPLHGQGDMQTACWNWALQGIVDQNQIIRPDVLCNWVTQSTLNDEIQRNGRSQRYTYEITLARGANANEVAWFGNAANRLALTAVRNRWEASDLGAAAIRATAIEIAKLAIQANGLVLSANNSVYKIRVYYYNHQTMPGFQHWWIEIEGAWFELFPGLDDIQVRRDAQQLGGIKLDFAIDVMGLNQRQIDRIMQTIYPVRWMPNASAQQCEGCNAEFGILTRRHHCRACGHIFCNACTTNRSVVARGALRPNAAPETGAVRVCDGCV